MLHTAFSIQKEGQLEHSTHFQKHIPRGELVDLLSKALLYLEVESHFKGDTVATTCKREFSLLEPHVCSSEPSTAATTASVNLSTFKDADSHKPNGDHSAKRKSSPPPSSAAPAEKRVKLDQGDLDPSTGMSLTLRHWWHSDLAIALTTRTPQEDLLAKKKKAPSLEHVATEGPLTPDLCLVLTGHKTEVRLIAV